MNAATVSPLSGADHRRIAADVVRSRMTPLLDANNADASLIEAIAARIATRAATLAELAAAAIDIETARPTVALVRNAGDELASDKSGGVGRG